MNHPIDPDALAAHRPPHLPQPLGLRPGRARAGRPARSRARRRDRPADVRGRSGDGVVNPPHFPIKAKRVIHLCMAGGPSQFESFDYKPKLKELHGKPFPESFTKGQQLAQLQNTR